MKNTFAYILIIFVSFAFSFETIKYFSKTIGDNSIVWINDFDCEEKGAESKKNNEKNENTGFSDDLYVNNKHLNNYQNSNQTLNSLYAKQHNNFSSSDFSQKVYSPPEIL